VISKRGINLNIDLFSPMSHEIKSPPLMDKNVMAGKLRNFPLNPEAGVDK
jgi:hypothetical protein